MRYRTHTLAARSFVAIAVIALVVVSTVGQRRFYIAPDDHTDYMWTANEATYRQAFLTMLDYYLDKMDATASNPSDSQMRWNCDGSLWMWEYEHNRTQEQFDRLISRLKDGHLSVPLNALVLVQGGSPAEAVIRGMYYPGLIERRTDVRFPIALAMEDQTLPYGLPSLWAGAGAKHSWKGVCDCATKVPQLRERDREIYYAGGRDGSRVLMKWNSHYGTSSDIGGYAEAPSVMAPINTAETNPNFRARYPFDIIGAFGTGADGLQYTSDEFVTAAKENSIGGRRVIISNQEDFFRDFEATYGADLETYAASYGNEWDVLVASMAEVSARIKRAVEKLRAAEAMATLVSLNAPSFMSTRTAERDKAMLDLGLYFEHDWTADGSIPRVERAAWSRRVEAEVSAYVERLYSDARVALANQINIGGVNPRFFVFNPLSWERTDFVDLPLVGGRNVRVVDLATGKAVPSQLQRSGSQLVLRITAENVPSVGYKVYELQPGDTSQTQVSLSSSGSTIENSSYKVTVAGDGSIVSLIDKKHGNRQLVRPIAGRVINDLGGDRTGTLSLASSGPVSITLRASSSSPIAHTTDVTLYRDIDRIDISNTITANFSDVKTWAYSFDLNSPDIWHEEVGAVIRARFVGGGGHYSPRNARYDWLTMNHFADVSDGSGSYGVTISNWDDYFMKVGGSSPGVLDTATPQINVLAGGQVDGSELGIPDQNGDSRFTQRFALWTHGAFDQTESMKIGLEHQNPLVAAMIDTRRSSSRPYPATSYSFLTISDPNVMLWALKPAEDGIGRGVIARVWNQGDSQSSYSLSLARPIASAERVTHIETTIAPAEVSDGRLIAPIDQQQIQTHLLRLK